MTVNDARDRLEFQLGKAAVVFSTQQRALEASLEALGVPLYQTPVVIPVTAPSWVLSAVLRAGGTPVLLDIELDTLQYDLADLKELLKDAEDAIVVVYRAFGKPLELDLLDVIQDQVCVQVTPSLTVDPELIPKFTFSIYNMASPVTISSGAVLYCAYQDSKKTIIQVRDSILGMGDVFDPEAASKFIRALKTYNTTMINTKPVILDYEFACRDSGLDYMIPAEDLHVHTYPIRVKDALKALVDLDSVGIAATIELQPLYTYPEIAQRYKDKAVYPNAELLHNKVISVPISKLYLKPIIEELTK